MINYNKNYEKAFNQLNAAQKQAVEQTEGPVMVVAGPGTGKTQLLAARIGNILKQPDIHPHNILCMTFTDAGVIAMRKRLLEFIGPEAYNVNIYTYHGFCNQVIQEHVDLFGGYQDLNMLTDLERVDVYMSLIDSFGDDHALKRFKGDLYYDKNRLANLFKTMKEENWEASNIEQAVKELPKALALKDDYIYKRGYTDKKTGKKYVKGDVKEPAIEKMVKKYDDLIVAANEFKNYKGEMNAVKRYDYQDMILWVIDQFSNNEDLLLQYQERFQYILVDEYQDTNGSQNELIYLLANYWDQPNLFVVGDDDQSIFRFQGANMDNIVDFKNRFDPSIIVLEENYRSGSHILKKATELIENNTERLSNADSNIQKNLIESRANKSPGVISYTKYHNVVHEEKGIINEIIKLKDAGEDLNKIAVIYRKHKDVVNIIKYLEFLDVPLNVKRKIDVLNMPAIQQIISLLSYINEETIKPYSADHRLFEILHFSYFEIAPRQIAKISLQLNREKVEFIKENKNKEVKRQERKWRDIISDKDWLTEKGIGEVDKILQFAGVIEAWIGDSMNLTVQMLLERILTDSTMLDDILRGENSTFMLQVVNTFFDFVKSESTMQPKIKLKDFLTTIQKMESNDLTIPFNRVVHSNNGVNFITAHSAKGLEFDKVFMIRCEKSNWIDKKSNSFQFPFPETLVKSSKASDEEDDRRLFFVAMTRAKNELHISYPLANEKGKEMEAVKFIHEIIDDTEDLKPFALEDDEITLYKAELLRFRKGKVQLIDGDLIDHVLKDYVMSVTNLNKYLTCPRSFYFEVILRVPQARSSYLGYGNAIHKTLYNLFSKIETSAERKIPSIEDVQQDYTISLDHYRQHFTDKEYTNFITLGKKILARYYETNVASWSLPRKYELEYRVRNVEYSGIPIKGDIDKIVYHDDHFYVVDYKTGNYKREKFKEPVQGDKAGDYWRQIIFYKMLLDADPHFTKTMQYGLIDFVEPDKRDDKYKSKKIEVSTFDIETVSEELVSTYKSIHNHEFDTGCEEENCRWCNFVADHLNAGE